MEVVRRPRSSRAALPSTERQSAIMNLRKVLVPLGGLVLLGVAYRGYGWPGVALVGGAIVMLLLLHFNRVMQALKRAADRPIGYVPSAVMLNAKLKPGMTLLHVVAMTRALGEQRSPQDQQPELFRWRDAGDSFVDAQFVDGRLREWTLVRPEAEDAPAPPAARARTTNGASSVASLRTSAGATGVAGAGCGEGHFAAQRFDQRRQQLTELAGGDGGIGVEVVVLALAVHAAGTAAFEYPSRKAILRICIASVSSKDTRPSQRHRQPRRPLAGGDVLAHLVDVERVPRVAHDGSSTRRRPSVRIRGRSRTRPAPAGCPASRPWQPPARPGSRAA